MIKDLAFFRNLETFSNFEIIITEDNKYNMTYEEKKSLYESIMIEIARVIKRQINEAKEESGVIVYRGMDKEHDDNKNVWVSDSEEYAQYWAEKEYNTNGIVKKYFLSSNVIEDLCNKDIFEEIMNDYDAWQEIPDDSYIWQEGEDAEYDLMHDLCFPSKRQISLLKKEGYNGYLFNYTDDCFSILIFNGKDLIPA